MPVLLQPNGASRVPHCSSGQGANGTTDQGTAAGNQKATFKTLVSEDT